MKQEKAEANLVREIEVVDVHVGGDLHRIVVGGVVEPRGTSVLDKMIHLRDHGDGLRKLLLEEPRGGHPSLYADLVVTPENPAAHAGFIIMELMGYPLISGTNTMSTAIALLETGRVPMRDGLNTVVLEAPGGLIDVEADCARGKVRSITYQASQPSYLAERNLSVEVPGFGTIAFDIIWTGAFYPMVRAEDLGFSLQREEESRIVDFARAFVPAVRDHGFRPFHPEFGDEGPLSFVVLVTDATKTEDGTWQRGVCCYEFPRHSVCRAPAGVPSTAALVQLADRGILSVGETLETRSIFGTCLQARFVDRDPYRGRDGMIAAVTGAGWITARSTLVVDFSDPLTPKDGLADFLASAG